MRTKYIMASLASAALLCLPACSSSIPTHTPAQPMQQQQKAPKIQRKVPGSMVTKQMDQLVDVGCILALGRPMDEEQMARAMSPCP